MEKLMKAAEKKDALAAERKKEAEDAPPDDGEGKRILSKKQMDALHAAKKANKNQRTAKAPSKSHAAAGEGSKIDKAKSAKQKKDEEKGTTIAQMASRQMGNVRK